MPRLLLAAACALLAFPAFAQHAPMPMPAHSSAADQAVMADMDKMNQAMSNAPMTGDPDKDFVAMMIPHHQGAIDMAKVELEYGKDPAIRKLAQAIVGAQENEIAGMKRWQAKHAGH